MNTDKLKAYYANYLSAGLDELKEVYDENIVFRDPLHQINGLDKLIQYFADGRKGLTQCEFEFHREVLSEQANIAVLEWTMCFGHARLSSGQKVVDGCSMVEIDPVSGLVVAHADYFDVGAMIYENIPVFGRAVSFVKRKASGAI